MRKHPDVSALTGCEVTQICLDYQVNLILAAQHEDGTDRVAATLTLGTSFTLTLANAEIVTVEPETGAGYGRTAQCRLALAGSGEVVGR